MRPEIGIVCFFFSSRRRHTRYWRDWSSDVCSSDLLCFFFVFMGLEAHSQRSFELNLWPQGPRVKSSDATDTAKVYVFQPAKPNGRAILICPGGGYGMLAMGKEGTDWAPFFNNMGITAVVLKYRMPRGKKEVPIGDAEEAMKLIRRNARNWSLNPNDVGKIGRAHV